MTIVSTMWMSSQACCQCWNLGVVGDLNTSKLRLTKSNIHQNNIDPLDS